MDIDFKSKQSIDPVYKQPEKGVEGVMSPMDPPNGFAPPSVPDVSYDELHPFLQEMVIEHKELTTELGKFEVCLESLKKDKQLTEKSAEAIDNFFSFFDREFIPHNKKEEKFLFPLLGKRFLETGEHSQSENPITAVDQLEDDHIQALQLATLTYNLIGLHSNLNDENSRMYLLAKAIESGSELIDLMKIHIFREDKILFPLAHTLIEYDQFNQLAQRKI